MTRLFSLDNTFGFESSWPLRTTSYQLIYNLLTAEMEFLARAGTWGSLPEDEHKDEPTPHDTKRKPSSTDSMVSVRFSDTGNYTFEEIPTPQLLEDSRNETLSELIGNEQPLEVEKSDHDDCALGFVGDDAVHVQLTRSSTRSGATTSIAEEEESSFADDICRPRRDSSGTASSAGSTHVDWEELERNEEEELKDETSDEVCCQPLFRGIVI